MTNSNWSRWWKPSSNSRGSVRKRFWPTVDTVRKRIWRTWNRPINRSARSTGSSPPASRSMASIDCRVSAVRCPKGATKVDRMKRKLQTKVGKAVYAARKCVVEPVFGQIKQARGFRQFLLRGKKKVKGEWALLCLAHNILRLHAAMQY